MASGRLWSLSSLSSFTRSFSTASNPISAFHIRNLAFSRRDPLLPKPASVSSFGTVHTDHMLEIDFNGEKWLPPNIRPTQHINIDPMAKVLHYGNSVFEGLKAFRGVDKEIRIFRIDKNMERMRDSARRAALPDFCPLQLEKLIVELVRVESEWIPCQRGTSLYIRPVFFGTEGTLGVGVSRTAKILVMCSPVGAYIGEAKQGISLAADPRYSRAALGGAGAFKMASNYAPTIQPADEAAKQWKCQQMLWLHGEERLLTEAGHMNIFVIWRTKDGSLELVTPPLTDGLILPGITRESLLSLAREWGEVVVSERYPSMAEVEIALKEDRLIEVFGAGTAATVSPVGRIVYVDGPTPKTLALPDGGPHYISTRLCEHIMDIQYGVTDRAEWVHVID